MPSRLSDLHPEHPNATVGVSHGDAHYPHTIVAWTRHRAAPYYRQQDHMELRAGTPSATVSRTVWHAARTLSRSGAAVHLAVDATLAGMPAVRRMRNHPDRLADVPVRPWVLTGSSAATTVPRRELAGLLADVVQHGRERIHTELARQLELFRYEPSLGRTSGEDAWRVESPDAWGLAAAIGLMPWRHAIAHDATDGTGSDNAAAAEPHPRCSGERLCMCPSCPRCGAIPDAAIRVSMKPCADCRTHGRDPRHHPRIARA